MIRQALTLAAALLCATPAMADPAIVQSWTVRGTPITIDQMDDGSYNIANGTAATGFRGVVYPKGHGFVGRITVRSANVADAAFYRPDLGIIVDLETGVVCTNVGTTGANCQ